MANGAIFNTAIGQQFGGNNRKSSTLINTNNGNTMDTEVTPEATPKQKAEATPQYRLNKEKVLDNDLRNRGLTVTATSKADQDKYWKGLSKEMQDQMTKFYNDGYSFDGARTLLEQVYGKSPQSLRVQRAGEAKGSDTWIGAVQDSLPMKVLDWINLPGKVTEGAMNLEQRASQGIQDWSNEKMGVNNNSTLFRDRANKNLKEKIDALPADKVKELTDKFNEDSALGKTRRSLYGSVENYIEEKSKNWWEDLLNIGTYESPAKTLPGDSKFENFVNKYGFQGDNGIAWDRIVANTPRSGVDLATSVLYAVTNPFDNLSDLAYLFTTKEGLDIVAEEYGSLEKLQETMQSDPFGFLSDIFDAKDLISRAKARQKKLQGALNKSKINTKKNEILKMASDIAKEYEKNEGKTTVDTLDNIGKLDKLTEDQKQLEEKQNKIDESQKKWEERAEQASTLSDFFIDTEPMNKAIINYLSEKGGIGKSIAYWYSLTQSPLSTIWKGVATEKQVEQNKQQTLDELDEGKEPEKETITVTNQVAPGIANSKAVQNVGEVWKRIRDKWEERATGLTPDMKARIQQNPYVKAYWDQVKATIEDEGLSNQEQIIEEQFLEEIGNELLARIEKEENRVEETGVMYNKIRNLPQTFDFTPTSQGIMNIFDRAGITIRPDGSLFFRSWSEAMTTDRAHAQILWNLMLKFMNGQALTSSEFLDLRSQLKAIENYKKGMDPTSAGKSAMLARQLRNEINKVAHKEIPGLEEIDAQYHKQISYLQQLKKDITYAQGPNSGKVRSNFYSIIRNINSANRKQYAGIISGIFPEIKDRVEAVRLMPKLIKAYQKNSGLLQSVVNMPKLLSAAQLASGDGFLKSAMTLLIGQFVEEGLIRPVDKKLRQATIDEVINQLDPIAKLKLEEAIKNAQDGQKLTEEEKMVLQEVTKKIAESIEEYRENLPKLPAPEADVINEDGTITLARGEPNTPEPQRKSIVEIQLHKPEAKVEEVQRIQEENNVDQQTAERIEDSVQAFIQQMGGEDGKVTTEEIDYNNFSTPTLNELRASDRIPVTEKEKIEEILKQRLDVVEEGEWEKMDKYFAVKIDNLNAEEQRIGKVGKNKVNKSVAQQQEANWTKRREAIIKEIEQFYYDGDPDSAIKAEEKFRQLEQTPRETIESYKKSQNYIYESAEREVLNRFLKEWDKQPKFIRELNSKQTEARDNLTNEVELLKGYEIETTPYNDRYVKKENGEVVDYGAIRYLEDGKIEVVTKDLMGFLDSGLLNYLPDDTIIRETGNNAYVTAQELRESGGNVNPSHYITDANGFRRIDADTDISKDNKMPWSYTKFEGTLTEQQKKEGLELYRIATTDPNQYGQSAKEQIDIARKRFVILNQQDGYTTALGLDQGEVNKQIASWVNYKPGVKELINSVRKGKDPKNRYTGIENMLMGLDDVVNESALESFVKSIKGEPGMPLRIEESKEMVKIMMALNTHIIYDLLSVEFTDRNNTHLVGGKEKSKGLYISDIDKILVGRGLPFTLEHEIGHYVDCLWGRQLYGNNNWRDGVSKGWVIGAINSKEAKKFAKDMIKFVSELDDNLEPWMNWNDVDRMNEATEQGKSHKEMLDAMYRSKPTEKFARFVQAFYGWVKYISENGIDEKSGKEWKSEHGDTYKVEKFKEFMKLLQDKAKLDNMGVLKDAKTHNTTGKTMLDTGEIYADVQQQSLFDEPKKTFTEQEMNEAFDKARPKLDAVIERIGREKNRNANLPPYRVFLSILEGYNPDLGEWVSNINKDVGQYFPASKYMQKREVVGIYNSLKQFMKEPEMKAWVEYNYNQNGHFGKELYDIMNEMENHPLEVPEVYKMGESLEKLNNYLYDMPYINLSALLGTYDPDPIEWKYNINKALKQNASYYLTLSKIYSIKNLLQDYINKEGAKSVLGTFDDEGIQKLVDLEKKGMEQKVSTYDEAQITKIGEELSTILLRLNQDTIDILGDIYDPDVDKWQKNIDRVKMIRKDYADIKLLHTSVLTNLKSKLKELSNYTPEQFKEVFGTDDKASENMYKFLNDVRKREAKLQAKGTTEAVTQLVALHNMELKNFERQIKNFDGKSPMPSIAVMDPNVPHEVGDFGEITLVFGKGTVDPKNNPDNVLYGSDAWTPMFPEIEEAGTLSTYRKRHEAIMEIIRPNKEWLESKGVKRPENFRFDFSQASAECLTDYIGRKDLNENSPLLAEQIMEDIASELEHSKAEFLEGDIELYERLEEGFDKLFANASATQYVIPARYFNPKQPNYGNIEHVSNVAKQIVGILPEKGIEKLHDDGYKEGGTRMNSFEDGIFREFSDTIEGIEDFPNNTPQEAGEIMLDLLVNEYGFDKETIQPYVEDIFGSLDETSKDRPLTPENVVEAMKNQGINRKVEPGSFRDMIEIEGHKLKDVEEARKQNFAKVFHGDWTGDIGDLERRYDNLVKMIKEGTSQEQIMNRTVANRIIEKYNTQELVEKYNGDLNKEAEALADVIKTIDRLDRMGTIEKLADFGIRTPADDPIGGVLDLINDVSSANSPILTAIKDSYDTDVNKFSENMNKQGFLDVPKDVFKRIIDVVEQGKKVPIRFAESKPERVVDLYNEVKYVLVPKGDVNKAKKIVKGTPLENKIVEYTPDNQTAPRSRKIKELQKLYGDIFFSMGGAIFPIAMLLKMAEVVGGGDDDEQEEA